MKAQELRIGNLLQRLDDIVCVNATYRSHFNCTNIKNGVDYGNNHQSNYQPIPLTEQWLLDFGAEKYEFDNEKPNQYRIGDRLFVIRDGDIVDYGSSVVLNYVHQLQNLFQALTGQELELNKK